MLLLWVTSTSNILDVLYSAFILPLFDYCDVVWCPTTVKQIAMIERIHCKFVKSLPPSTKLSFTFFTLMERHRYCTAIQVFKSIRKSTSSYLQGIYYFKDVTGRVSCNRNRLLSAIMGRGVFINSVEQLKLCCCRSCFSVFF